MKSSFVNLYQELVILAPALPLSGKTVLVTRAASQSSQFALLLKQQGATVLEMPALEITAPSSWEPLDRAIAELEQFDWLILTSTNGVDCFWQRLLAQSSAQEQALERLSRIKIAVVGQKTAERLQQQGRHADFVPPDFVADALIEHFPEPEHLPQLKLLFPRVETGGREVLVRQFTAAGATVVEVPAYQSSCAQSMPPEVAAALEQGQVDIITFASSKTVNCFYQLLQTQFSPLESVLIPAICLASIGPQTSATCRQRFGRVDLEAADYTLDGLTQAIVQWITN
jgi:uroporphyrinogen III methyltransferase/synthase